MRLCSLTKTVGFLSGTRGLLEAAIEAAIDAASPREAFVVLNRCGKVLNLPTSLRLPPPNLNDEVLRTKPVLEVTAEEADVEVEAEAAFEGFSAS